MYESLPDALRALTGESYDKKPLAMLRGKVWLSHAMQLSGLEPAEFFKRHVRRGRTRSNLEKKWECGDVTPRRQSVAGVERSLRGSRWVYDLPLWDLLVDEHIGGKRLARIADGYTVTREWVCMWLFPGDEKRLENRSIPVGLYPDTGQLVARNDLWGFIGCVLRTRMCERDRLAIHHLEASKDMFRALPGALKQPWLRPYASELLLALHILRRRVPLSFVLFDVDEQIILRQADDSSHQPWRERRPWDPHLGVFAGIDDPTLPARVVPGLEVREWAVKAAARREARLVKKVARQDLLGRLETSLQPRRPG